MRRPSLLTFALFFLIPLQTILFSQTNITQQQYEEDFDYLWKNVFDWYAYFDQKETDWNRVRGVYRPKLKEINTQRDFITLLESVLEELYDFHTHLNTNTASSPRLVPSGAGIWAEWRGGSALITEVRSGSNAERAGLKAGAQITSFNGIPIDEAVSRRLGKSLRRINQQVKNWALVITLAGRRNEKRNLEVIEDGNTMAISINDQLPGVASKPEPKLLINYHRLPGSFGYIRVNNSLADTDLIKQFDRALAELKNTKGLILDLRDTPGGGNTTVARGIMGRFIDHEMPYQKHSIPAEERRYGTKRSWIELVSPRGVFIYRAPPVVLVDHWTGSMGEGIAIGMDGMKRGTVVGTGMAGLIGATSTIRLPNTGIGVSFPTEKLFHVNGTPREDFVPPLYVDLLKRENKIRKDAIFDVGKRVLKMASGSIGGVQRFPVRLTTHWSGGA